MEPKFNRMKILLIILGLATPFFIQASSPVDSIGVENVQGSRFIKHQVGDGEGWYSIARKYGISYSELRLANKNQDDKLIKGKVLLVPAKAKVNDPRFQKNFIDKEKSVSGKTEQPVQGKKAVNKIHKVAKSETLFSIAKKYNVQVEDIKDWNNLKNNSIKPGQSLIVGHNSDIHPLVHESAIKEEKTGNSSSSSTPAKTESNPPAVTIEPRKAETVIIPTATEEKPKLEPRKEDRKYTFSNGRKEVNEQGVASWIEDEDINPNKYYALHRTAPNGTIIKITNRMNNKSIFVKVVGKLPDSGDNEGLIIKVSKASAEKLGVLDQRFSADLIYGISDK